ncbi:MAG: hypothetical protein Q9173_003603 [Seirophora scorigena]
MSSTITADQWNQRKEEILRLYIDEGWTLKPVMRKMRSPDFHPTESQYRTKLKRWKRRKPRQNHQPRAHTAPPIARVTVSQPSTQGSDQVQSHSQNYTGTSQQVFGDRGHAAHSVEQRSIQIPPFAAAELIPPVPSSQVENSWHVELGELYNGFLPSSVEHQSTAYGPLSNMVHHQSIPGIDVPEIDIPEIDTHYEQTYGEDLLDYDQIRNAMRNRTAENTHGGQVSMRSLIISSVIGTAALAIYGVAGAALPVNDVENYEPSVSSHELLSERCFRNTEGELICPGMHKRDHCWEASNGQIQCSADDGFNVDVDYTTTASPAASTITSPAEETPVQTQSSSTLSDDMAADGDSTAGTGTTCVHTAEGYIQCGNAMDKRDGDSIVPPISSFPSADADEDGTAGTGVTCVHTAKGFIECGNVMVKRDGDSIVPPVSSFPSTDVATTDEDGTAGTGVTCVHTAEGFIECGDPMVKRDGDSIVTSMSAFPSTDYLMAAKRDDVVIRAAGEKGCHAEMKGYFFGRHVQLCQGELVKGTAYYQRMTHGAGRWDDDIMDLCFKQAGCDDGLEWAPSSKARAKRGVVMVQRKPIKIHAHGCHTVTQPSFYSRSGTNNAGRCDKELFRGSPTRLGGPVAWNQILIDQCFAKGAYCEKGKRDVIPAAVEIRGIEERDPRKVEINYRGCHATSRAPFFSQPGSLRCRTELFKGSPKRDGGPVAWNQHVVDKCFEPGAYCEKKKRDIVTTSVESRGVEERVPLPPPIEINWRGCHAISRPSFYAQAHEGHGYGCDNELVKGPKKWNQNLIDKCFQKGAYCDKVKRDAIPDSKEVVVLERGVQMYKEYTKNIPGESVLSAGGTVIYATGLMDYTGKGKCNVHYRKYYFEGLKNRGMNAPRCDKEMKKGPAKWNQEMVDECFDIRDCFHLKRDVLPESESLSQIRDDGFAGSIEYGNEKRDVDPALPMESSTDDALDTSDDCRAVRIQLYACTDPDPSHCFANVWCCGDACDGSDVVGPASAAPDAPPPSVKAVKRNVPTPPTGLLGVLNKETSAQCLLDHSCGDLKHKVGKVSPVLPHLDPQYPSPSSAHYSNDG